MNVATGGATGNVTSKGSRNLIRLNWRNDININALMGQDIRSDLTITAIVAKADQHKNAIRVEL